MQRLQNAQRDRLRDGAHFRRHVRKKADFFTGSVLVAEDLIHGEAAFGGELFERNAPIRMLPEMLTRGFYRLPVFFTQRLVGRVHHHFEQLENGGDLIGAKQLNQFMGVLFGFGCINGHCVLPDSG
jgi:hypothetical protein